MLLQNDYGFLLRPVILAGHAHNLLQRRHTIEHLLPAVLAHGDEAVAAGLFEESVGVGLLRDEVLDGRGDHDQLVDGGTAIVAGAAAGGAAGRGR